MKLNKRDQQLADYQEEMKMIGPQKQPASVNQINAQQKYAERQLPHLINPKQTSINDFDKLPGSYRNQESCATCAHCFIKHEYEAVPELFCSLNAPPRPPCGSVLMREMHAPRSHDGLTLDEYDTVWDAADKLWDDWSLVRIVTQRGICDHHQKADGNLLEYIEPPYDGEILGG